MLYGFSFPELDWETSPDLAFPEQVYSFDGGEKKKKTETKTLLPQQKLKTAKQLTQGAQLTQA